ncbi:MAG: OB-fold domain-containing protein [Acidimicrobiia bacterium]|nr:OB-fold domain-containing protein [Acidimicrobiia bacterium]
MSGPRVPAVEGLFTDDGVVARLLGSRCATCGTPYFPASSRCHHPDCDDSATEDASFGPSGTVWSYSVQNYPPPAPAIYDEPYEPYALAVVDLDDGLRVVGRMEPGGSAPVVGGRVEVVVGPIRTDDDGTERTSWMFRTV